MFKRALLLALVLGLWSGLAVAGETDDLKQTVSDLTAQTADKEKMDSLGATKVELNQLRTWIQTAQNAIQEEAEKKTRRFFTLIRSQLKLVDELIGLSRVEDQQAKLQREITAQKTLLGATKKQLLDKQARLRALNMKDQ